ncbi:unnamed protein product [Bathycoccus prasinos]|jgi:acid phosphatase family membrane protein YuiD|mmetsp:Transcript_5612/g.18905  ORF Transcript_5612/g.18905 Transcript_5612/m.18905 type:complete len:202 (+) Transcript_5612:119-724(+)
MAEKEKNIFDNVALLSALLALLVAQLLKPLTHYVGTKKWKPSLAIGSGGFPSSHASFVVALATGAGVERGTADTSFAVAAVLAIVVMYDAMGVRRQAGYHASAINSLISGAYGSNSQNRNSSSGNIDATLELEDEETPTPKSPLFSADGFDQFIKNIQNQPLREHIGHTPVQVCFGGLTGLVIGLVVGLNAQIEHRGLFHS